MFKLPFLLLCREWIGRAEGSKNEENYEKFLANSHGVLLQWREKWLHKGNGKV